jgi:hypothetical protein
MTNEDDAGQEHLTVAEASERATRRWLEDAWRHGEVMVDEDRPWVVTPVQPVDGFVAAATEHPGMDASEHD